MNNLHLAGDVLAAAAAARVFGADVRRLLRRAVAAGVRMGATELAHSRGHEQREGHR